MKVSGLLHFSASLSLLNIAIEVIKWDAVWAVEPVWGFWGRDKAFVPLGIPTRDRPALSLVAIPTKLIWLPCSLFR
jgi:hypothetical protein